MITVYFQVLLLACVTLFLLAFWGYKTYIAPYMMFPSSWAGIKSACFALSGRIPKNIPRSRYTFQLMVEDCKKNLSEGFRVLWTPLPYVLVYNEEAVKTLSNSQAALSKAQKYHVLVDGLGMGLVTSHSELWRKRRKMFQPAFHSSLLKSHVPVFNKNATNLVQRLLTMAKEPIQILDPLKTTAFDNLLKTMFGSYLETPTEKAEQFVYINEELESLFIERTLNPILERKLMLPFFPSGRKFLKYVKDLRSISEEMLLRLKDSVMGKKDVNSDSEENPELYGTSHLKSFADILIQSHLEDPSFTMQDMHDELTTILTAGYESLAHGLMWTLFLLGHHEDVQEELYNEIEPFMGSDISYEDVHRLIYTECVIKEAFRLYSPVPLYGRCLEDDVQCGKYNLPKGTNIIFFAYVLHRNPTIYPNPEKFDPERFRNISDSKSWGFVPFSEGIRHCIGKKFAMIQMKITLAHIIQNFKVTSLQRVEDIKVNWRVVLIPSEPIRLQLTPRCHIFQQKVE